MSPSEAPPAAPTFTTEEARIRVGTALALIELAAQVLEEVPPPETAFSLGDRELFRYLQAAETARSSLVGHELGDSVDSPGRESALGGGQRIYAWDDEETERHFVEAMRDWSEHQ